MPWIRCHKCGRTVKPTILAVAEGINYVHTVQCTACGATSQPHTYARDALNEVGQIRQGGEGARGDFMPRGHEDVLLRPLGDDRGWRR